MSPLELTQPLSAQAPRPRLHLIPFHGVLGANARLRAAIFPNSPQSTTKHAADASGAEGLKKVLAIQGFPAA
jgi:hypothetical protein